MTKTLKGQLNFYSETGTEGGYWAFQDETFTHLFPPNQWRCPRCGRVWDKDRVPEEPKPSFSYWRDGWTEDGTTYMGGYFGKDEPHPELPLCRPGDEDSLDCRWNAERNATSLDCYENGHAEWQSPAERWPDGIWSYEGLHVLNDGDHLTIWDEDRTEQVWDGVIDLCEHDLFTEGAGGMWIHADQKGIPREMWSEWFFRGLPADLVTQ